MNEQQRSLFQTLYPHADIHSVSDNILERFMSRDYIKNKQDEVQVMESLYDYLLSQDLIYVDP